MSNFDIIYKEEIDKAFVSEQRQYLVGNLKLPQVLNFIKDDNVEVGITNYKEYKVELPHYHTDVSEYHFIIKGETKYVNVSENKEYLFKEGDFFIIRPNTIYVQKSLKGSEILFIKVPGLNDKTPCETTEQMNIWFKNWDNVW